MHFDSAFKPGLSQAALRTLRSRCGAGGAAAGSAGRVSEGGGEGGGGEESHAVSEEGQAILPLLTVSGGCLLGMGLGLGIQGFCAGGV